MNWVTLDTAAVQAAMPSDLATEYANWLTQYPEKSGRLADITATTVSEFRDSIRSNPANALDPDPNKIPESAIRHAQSIVFFQLAMEMGLDIDTEGTQSMTRADMFLRQIAYKHFATTAEGGTSASPRYEVPQREPARALPAILGLMLCLGFASPASAGWIAKKSQLDDTRVDVTFTPTTYTNSATTLFGHLQGIDRYLQPFGLLFSAYGSTDSRLSVLESYGDWRMGGIMMSPFSISTLSSPVRFSMSTSVGSWPFPNLAIEGSHAGWFLTANRDVDVFGLIQHFGTLASIPRPLLVPNVTIGSQASNTTNLVYGAFHMREGGTATPRSTVLTPFGLWMTTNSFLTSLGDPTSLYFVVVSPPSTNRLFP
jgi:hypothetical protein